MMFEKYLSKTEFDSYEDFYGNFKINVPDDFNFGFDVVDAIAKETPDKIAIDWCDEDGKAKKFTFKEIHDESNRVANFFKSIGIKKGDHVMLILKRRYEFWFCIIALHKIGAIGIPATHLLTSKDIVYRNNAANIKMIVCIDDPGVIGHINDSQSQSPTLKYKISLNTKADGWLSLHEEMNKASTEFIRPSGSESTTKKDTMLLYFTSGTTGMPKMVLHDFGYPLAHIITAKYWQNVIDGGLHLTVADTGWAKAAWGKIYGQWLCGSAVFVYDYEKFVPHEMLEVISSHKVTTFCAPPTIYRFFIKEDLSKYDLSSLKHCVVAGEPLNPEVFSQFFKATGLKLFEVYGQTELVPTIGTYPWVTPKPGSMGKPTPGYDIDLVDENGESCEVGSVGQIVVRTDIMMPPGIFMGYYNDPELTNSVWHDNLYYTGDTAWRDEDGYYWFVGRADDLIKSSGYRIGPFEVESALIEHPAVLECAITAVPDPIRGQIVKATVILAKGYVGSNDLIIELQNHVKKVTAPYKYPRIIEFSDELPKTISGKIRRVEIREGDQDTK